MMKSAVFVALAIVISADFVIKVDAVAGKFSLAVVIIKMQIEFSIRRFSLALSLFPIWCVTLSLFLSLGTKTF